jgi:hypothetical protein
MSFSPLSTYPINSRQPGTTLAKLLLKYRSRYRFLMGYFSNSLSARILAASAETFSRPEEYPLR